MNFGKYKNVRDAAWKCLIDYEFSSLPIHLSTIMEAEQINFVKNSSVGILSKNISGASLYQHGEWYIVINDVEPVARQRFTTAHELGHIFLGHTLSKDGQYTRFNIKDRPNEEREADMFAIRLLAPACVIWGLNIHTPEEIAKYCNISLQAAAIRAERISILYQRGKFLSDPLERQVFRQFEPYIQSILSQREIDTI